MLSTAKRIIAPVYYGPFSAADGVVHINPANMGRGDRDADLWLIAFPLVTAGTLVVRFRDNSPASHMLSTTDDAGWLRFDEAVAMDGTKANAAWLEGGRVRDFLVRKTGVTLALGSEFYVSLTAYEYAKG